MKKYYKLLEWCKQQEEGKSILVNYTTLQVIREYEDKIWLEENINIVILGMFIKIYR